jgi:hypothetical protein
LEERAKEGWKSPSSNKAHREVEMLKELRSGWVLGGEEFRDRMIDLASGVIRGRKRGILHVCKD